MQEVEWSLLKNVLLPPPELFDELFVGLGPQQPSATLGHLLESLAAEVT